MSKLRFLAWLSCWCLMASAGHAAKTEARLVLAANTARPGETILAAVQLKMQPRWHTYWRYAGDSGAPTTIKWTLPAGVSAGEILWPVPEKDVSAGLTTYIYLNEAALLVPITLAENVPAGEIELKAAVAWLECEQVCVPGKAEVKATLTVGPASKASADAGLIEAALKKLPLKGLELARRARQNAAQQGHQETGGRLAVATGGIDRREVRSRHGQGLRGANGDCVQWNGRSHKLDAPR